jgi:DNA polymerase-4
MVVRRILHVDMDAFYASVEQRDRPELRGLPVAVGGMQRGVVAAASYEARRFGVHSAMPMSRALRLCPKLCVVPPDFAKYKAVSAQVLAIFAQVTPLVEPLSLDEAYLDVTENSFGEPLGVNVARRIKQAILEETGLTASAGVAPNKFLAKVASAFRKPDGLTVIPPSRVEEFLRDLPVDALWGVGPVTAEKLRAAGIVKLADVRRVGTAELARLVGRFAETLRDLAHGVDPRPVEPHRIRKSVGSETTFPVDLTDLSQIRGEVDSLCREGALWLERHERYARTVTLKVRYADFTTITRSETLDEPSRSMPLLIDKALSLLEKTEAGPRAVRLLGVSLHGLCDTTEKPQRLVRPQLKKGTTMGSLGDEGPAQLVLPFLAQEEIPIST